MDRDEFIKKVDEKVKLIRSEKDFSQDKMSEIIGISKKTLIQIEKGRSSLGWTGAVTVCTLFKDSEILDMTFGGNPEDIILSLSFNGYEIKYEKTMGGKIWWKDVEALGNYKIQQNIISKHFRILDEIDRRICSSFQYDIVKKILKECNDNEKKTK